MAGPYDFIGQDDQRQGLLASLNWTKQLRLSDVFANPLVIGADFAMTGLLYNPIAGPKALERSMSASQWAGFQGRVAKRFGSATPEHMQAYVMKMNAAELGSNPGRYAGKIGGTFGRDVAMQESMVSNFGARAAGRMSFARAATGLSRFMLAYTAIDLGIGVMKSIAEAAGSYQRPNRANPTRTLETGGISVDTRHAQTQRMRSIQAIHNSQLSTRAAMGNEAAFMHLS